MNVAVLFGYEVSLFGRCSGVFFMQTKNAAADCIGIGGIGSKRVIRNRCCFFFLHTEESKVVVSFDL